MPGGFRYTAAHTSSIDFLCHRAQLRIAVPDSHSLMPTLMAASPQLQIRKTPRRFQFSLARLMIAMTLIALLLGFSSVISGTILLFIWIILYTLPACFAACMVYGRGDLQAFALGALVPCIPLLLASPGTAPSFVGGIAMAFATLIASGICGVVAVATRRWIVANNNE